jgi:hypothetical protein
MSWEWDFSCAPQPLCGAELPDCTKGLKWAPDGTCLLTACDDNWLRLYELPPDALGVGGANEDAPAEPAAQLLAPAVCARESETVYDYCWYPGMNSAVPATCCFASTSRDQPVHLWDAFTGQLRASYTAYDRMDEVAAAHSLAFSSDGTRLLCGFDRAVRIFDTARPGRPIASRPTVKTKRSRDGLRGILSTIAVDLSGSGMYAVGSYSGATGVYAEEGGELVFLLGGHTAGVTHVAYSPDGRTLVTGSRRDGRLLCWDVRLTGKPLRACERLARSNQRILFTIDRTSRWLVTGSQDGRALAFDLHAPDGSEAAQPAVLFHAPHAVNAAMLHPFLPLVGIATGERQTPRLDSDGEGGPAEAEAEAEAARAGHAHAFLVLETGWRATAADAGLGEDEPMEPVAPPSPPADRPAIAQSPRHGEPPARAADEADAEAEAGDSLSLESVEAARAASLALLDELAREVVGQ